MQRKDTPRAVSTDYMTNTEKGFPRRITWKVIAGPELTEAQKTDIVFDQHDLKIRQLI